MEDERIANDNAKKKRFKILEDMERRKIDYSKLTILN